jgi:phosphoesterase RecJ-like protein
MRVHGPYDAAILLECDGVERTRLRGLEDLFLINIDHHVTGQQFAALNWIDLHASSVGAMVYRLAMAAGAEITPEMAACLYTTLLTDTGTFCFGAVDESTFALARELVHAGADPLAIAHEVYFSVPVAKLLLLGAALRRLKREGRLAWLWVTHQDMVQSCAAEEDCEGFVNLALGIAGVDIAVFLRELSEGLIRLSLRSRGKVHVAAVAARLGGGGHENAAGCTLEGPMQRALDEILMELRHEAGKLTAAPD